MERGVTEGSPLSPSLFNIFIDPQAAAVTDASGGRWQNYLNLFAEDIVLLAPSEAEMQKLLDNSGDWAARNGLTWGIRNAMRSWQTRRRKAIVAKRRRIAVCGIS